MKKFLIVLITVIVTAGLVGGGVYYMMKKKSDSDTKSLNDRISALETQLNTASTKEAVSPATADTAPTVDPTEGWKTLNITSRGVSFKYPSSIGTPKTEDYTASSEGPTVDIDSYEVTFEGNSALQIANARVVRFSDYAKDAQFKAKADAIKQIYTSKSATGGKKLFATFINAAFLAAGEPQYIQTTDGKYRGIYYFASIGQSYSTTIDCIVLMTDGTDNVIQFHFSQNSDKASQYQATIQQENSPFVQYVNTLTAASTDTIAKDLTAIYKNMALSIKPL